MLLVALSNTIGLQFQSNSSSAQTTPESLTEDPIELPLCCTKGKRAFLDNKFDQAMLAFLDYMQQFEEEAETGEPALCTGSMWRRPWSQ